MRIAPSAATTAATILIAAALSTSAFATDGGRGGDREPAGGAFMTSYPEQGSTGIQRGGPPRSADIPRGYGRPDTTGSIGRAPRPRSPGW